MFNNLEKIDDYRWRIPKSYMAGMRVDGIILANDRMIEDVRADKAAQQVADVACLPGILKYSLAMPDIHWGYGFPIGGVAATDIEAGGVISPGKSPGSGRLLQNPPTSITALRGKIG